jgi:hypothetical protein
MLSFNSLLSTYFFTDDFSIDFLNDFLEILLSILFRVEQERLRLLAVIGVQWRGFERRATLIFWDFATCLAMRAFNFLLCFGVCKVFFVGKRVELL